MSEFLFHYQKVNPATWAYLSSLLMIGLYFKFSRFWSMRNLDLVLLILLAPGLLLVHYGQDTRKAARLLSQAEAEAAAAVEAAADDAVEPVPDPAADEPAASDSASVRPIAPDDPLPASATREPMQTIIEAITAPEALANDEPVETPKSLAQTYAEAGVRGERMGYVWLFAVGGLILIRLLIDPTMVRRPLLEPNLSPGGLTFIGISLFVFLMANVIVNEPTEDIGRRPRNAPGYALIQELPRIRTVELDDPAVPTVAVPRDEAKPRGAAVTKIVVILAQLAIVLAMIGIGYRHFDNTKMGVGAATLYLMLPYTAQMTGLPEHAVPAALLLWAVFCYRRPLTAGVFMGLAISVGYYPLYLLPLWLSFYWQRGLMRFVSGVVSMLLVMASVLIFEAQDLPDYLLHVRSMFGALPFRMRDLGGVWGLGWDPVYRIPMLTAFVALAFSFALWPAQKNLGTLLSCSAAVMLAAQFWDGDSGGLYMAWYLPLLLLTIFRPNLEDRVALTVLGDGWFPRRRVTTAGLERAA